MKFQLIIFVFISLFSFGQGFQNPIIINNFKESGKHKKSKNIEMFIKNVQYLGEFKDTIEIEKTSNQAKPIGDNKILIRDSLSKNYSFYGNGKLIITVDTSQNVVIEGYKWVFRKRVRKYYKAFPIFISNQTDTTTIIGYGFNVPITLEALDSGKTWKHIENKYIYSCGVGLEYILLKTNNILCVFAPLYKGPYKTKLRYNLGLNYSNEFWGTINRRQFVFNKKTIRW